MKTTIPNTRIRNALALAGVIATVALATILPAAFLHANSQAQSTPSTISGTILNGTAGATLPQDLEVFLLVIDEQQEAIIERISANVDQDGRFEVNAPTLSDGQFYRVVADDGIYTPYKDIVDPAAHTETFLTVFDSTTSLDDISIKSYGVVLPRIEPADNSIAVLAAISFTNKGDKVYVADLADPALTGLKLLRFNLPEGYEALSVESDLPSGNVMEINTGFALSNPVPPGEWNLIVSYTATYEENTLRYPFRLPFGADRVSFLLPDGKGELAGRGLTKGDTAILNDITYIQYEGTDYPRGSELDITITGLPEPGVSSQLLAFVSSGQFQVAIAVSVALLLAGSLAAFLLLRRQPSLEPVKADPTASDRTEIIRQIAQLDRQHEAGTIPDSEYNQHRKTLMKSAIEADDQRRQT